MVSIDEIALSQEQLDSSDDWIQLRARFVAWVNSYTPQKNVVNVIAKYFGDLFEERDIWKYAKPGVSIPTSGTRLYERVNAGEIGKYNQPEIIMENKNAGYSKLAPVQGVTKNEVLIQRIANQEKKYAYTIPADELWDIRSKVSNRVENDQTIGLIMDFFNEYYSRWMQVKVDNKINKSAGLRNAIIVYAMYYAFKAAGKEPFWYIETASMLGYSLSDENVASVNNIILAANPELLQSEPLLSTDLLGFSELVNVRFFNNIKKKYLSENKKFIKSPRTFIMLSAALLQHCLALAPGMEKHGKVPWINEIKLNQHTLSDYTFEIVPRSSGSASPFDIIKTDIQKRYPTWVSILAAAKPEVAILKQQGQRT
jgi:hypothetical protein